MSTTPVSIEHCRRRGAPLGNTNNLKHGFYARKFRTAEITDLNNHTFAGLEEEAVMLRAVMRRVVELSATAQTIEQNVSILRVLAIACASLTRIARANIILAREDAGAALSEALEGALEEMEALHKRTPSVTHPHLDPQEDEDQFLPDLAPDGPDLDFDDDDPYPHPSIEPN